MTTTMTRSAPRLAADDLLADLDPASLRLIGTAPQFLAAPTWCLVRRGRTWELHAAHALSYDSEQQPLLLSCGAALEHLVVLLRGHGARLDVEVLPDSGAIAEVTVLGRQAPTADDRQLLAALAQPASDAPEEDPRLGRVAESERLLTQTIQGLEADLVWSMLDAPRPDIRGLFVITSNTWQRRTTTIVTPNDTPVDWLHAGRAVGRLRLRARTLGLDAQPLMDGLNRRQTRSRMRFDWYLWAVPQVQLLIVRP